MDEDIKTPEEETPIVDIEPSADDLAEIDTPAVEPDIEITP